MELFSEALQEAFRLLVSLDPELYGIIFLSLRVSLTAVVLAALFSVPAAVAVALSDFPGKRLLMTAINTLMSLPPVVVGLVVYILLSNRTGLFPETRLLYTPFAMVAAQVLLAVPIIMGLTVTAVQTIDHQIRHTAKTLGATPAQTLVLIVREGRMAIGAAVLAGFGRLMAEVGAVMMVGGNIRFQTRVMTTAIALQKSMGEFQQALALGFVLLAVSFLITAGLEALRGYGEGARS